MVRVEVCLYVNFDGCCFVVICFFIFLCIGKIEMLDCNILLVVNDVCVNNVGFVVVIFSIVLLIEYGVYLWYGRFELFDDVGYYCKYCVIILCVGFEDVVKCE